jgi:hypothetical protein
MATQGIDGLMAINGTLLDQLTGLIANQINGVGEGLQHG